MAGSWSPPPRGGLPYALRSVRPPSPPPPKREARRRRHEVDGGCQQSREGLERVLGRAVLRRLLAPFPFGSAQLSLELADPGAQPLDLVGADCVRTGITR